MRKSAGEDMSIFLGERIKHLILSKGYRQADVASKLGVSPSRLSNYITGVRMPDFFMLCRIAFLLGVSVSYFSPDADSGAVDESVYIIKIKGRCSVALERA